MRLTRAVLASVTLVSTTAAIAAQPVARPTDPDATASARVVMAVQPVGRVSYDGLTLPLTSPDGRFLVAQSSTTGRPPSWEAVLAVADDASNRAAPTPPPVGIRLSSFSIELPEPRPPGETGERGAAVKPSPTARLKPIDAAEPLPAGLVLGRSSTTAGYLVESIRDNGERWIGRVGWLNQRVEWIAVTPGTVLAHATDAPAGPTVLAYVARPVHEPAAEPGEPARAGGFSRLIVRFKSGSAGSRPMEYVAPPGETVAFPVYSADGGSLGVLALRAGRMELLAFNLTDAAAASDVSLRPIARLELGELPAAASASGLAAMQFAYQCVAATQSPPWIAGADVAAADGRGAMLIRGLSVFSPRDAAPLWWNPYGDRVLLAARGTLTSIPFRHTEWGILVAGNTELGYQPLRSVRREGAAAEDQFGREVQVIAGRSIPRATTRRVPGSSDDRDTTMIVLLTPARSADDRSLEVVLVAPASPEANRLP